MNDSLHVLSYLILISLRAVIMFYIFYHTQYQQRYDVQQTLNTSLLKYWLG